ncbi:MAG: YbaK/EbsC family protein [Candidatus Hydrogenedentes bacterium]|nr:YbaK/EbsC family protein [Candidatus Hydrogenedentota bacterium]
MPIKRLKEFLDQKGVKYVSIGHSKAFTAQEVAASAHIPGREMAKTVMVKLDGKMAMVAAPANRKVDMESLRRATKASRVELASEQEFVAMFPECEVGAMPPFGNLYGLDVYVEEELAKDENIAFNAGTHTELIKMAYRDFERLAQPTAFSA